MDNAQLAQDLKDGKLDSPSRLAEEYGPVLKGFIERKYGSIGDVEEAVMDTLAVVVEKIDTYDPTKSKSKHPFFNWMLTIADRKAIDCVRRQEREMAELRTWGITELVDYESLTEHAETRERRSIRRMTNPGQDTARGKHLNVKRHTSAEVIAAGSRQKRVVGEIIGGLPPTYQDILRDIGNGLSYDDIATIEKIPRQQVKVRVQRARKMAKDRLYKTEAFRGMPVIQFNVSFNMLLPMCVVVDDRILDYYLRMIEPKPLSNAFHNRFMERVEEVKFRRRLKNWRLGFRNIVSGLRSSSGVAQEEVAAGTGMLLPTYSRFEKGTLPPYRLPLESLATIRSSLGIKGEYLLSLIGDYPIRESNVQAIRRKEQFLVDAERRLRQLSSW